MKRQIAIFAGLCFSTLVASVAFDILNAQGIFDVPKVIVKKYDYPMLNPDGTPTNSRIEYFYNTKSKSCFARITDSKLEAIDVVAPNPTSARSPMAVVSNDSPTPNTAKMIDTIFYLDVNNANCK